MTSTNTESLYQKLGGKPAVQAVVNNFYERVLADPLLQDFFEDTDMDRQRRHQVAFVSMALGGPKEYAGKAMKAAHTGMGIQEQHFGAVAGHLSTALSWAGVAEEDVNTVIGVVATLKDDIVGA